MAPDPEQLGMTELLEGVVIKLLGCGNYSLDRSIDYKYCAFQIEFMLILGITRWLLHHFDMRR